MQWDAWGDSAEAARLSPQRLACSSRARRVGRTARRRPPSRGPRSAPSALTDAHRAALGGARRRRARAHRRRDPAAARRRQVDPGPAAPRSTDTAGRARRGRAPGLARRGRRGAAAGAREQRIAVVPFGGGTSVVGGVDPVPRRLRRGASRSTCAASTRWSTSTTVSGDRRLAAGPDRPAGRGAARRARVLRSATSRRASSSPRSAGSPRPGPPARPPPATAGSTTWSPACASPPRPAPSTLGRAPGIAAGPDLRQLFARLRGRVRRHHRGRGAGAPGARDDALRGVDVPRLRDRRRRAARRSMQPGTGADRAAAVRRGRDRHQPGHSPATSAASTTGGLPRDQRRSRAPPRTCSRAAREAPRCSTAAGGTALGRGPAARAWEHGRFNAPYLRDALLERRRARRDARDGDGLVQPDAAARRGDRPR